ncbi:Phosphopantetheine adenylyltransferase [Candidatus Hepatincola sp. Av]
MNKKAIYPGSFDPITYGHIDIISRSLKFLDTLIIGVGSNHNKSSLFNHNEKKEIIIKALAEHLTQSELKKITIAHFEGLLVNFAKERHVNLIIRGIRVFSDFEYEFNLANINLKLMPEIETIFLPTVENKQYIGSTSLKEIVALGGDASSFAPSSVIKALKEKIKEL